MNSGRLVAVYPDSAHPTGAALCAKGRAAPEMVASPSRLLKPMRRTRPRGNSDPGWAAIEWDEALGEIAARLGSIRSAHGAEAVAFAVTTPSGTPMVDSFEWVERFVRCFGSPNLIYAVEICGWHKDFAHALTFGRGIGTADYDNADTIVLWGHNPARTWLAQATRIASARRRGATVVVIDPKRGGSGEDADLWLPIRPGTDAALAMGAIRHLLKTGRFDHEFVRTWTNAAVLVDRADGRFIRAEAFWLGTEGFVVLDPEGNPARLGRCTPRLHVNTELRLLDGSTLCCASALTLLAEEAERYVPAFVEESTGLSAPDQERFYRLFEGSPRLAYHCWTGVGQHSNATQTERAIATLYALTGAVDRVGGNIWTVPPPTRPVNDYSLLPPGQQAKALGLAELPLGPPSRGWITARDFCRSVLEGEPYQVRGLMSFGTNFVVSQGGSARNEAALAALEFHVHVDMHLNPTAMNADIVLPANMPWEREALKIGFEITQAAAELVQLRPRMVPAAGQARADYEIAFDLACRLGHRDTFFGGSVEAGWNHQLEPAGLTVEALRHSPGGIAVPQSWTERKYGVDGFATQTGRVELYSELLLAHGHAPLPGYVQPAGWDGPLPLRLVTAKSGWFVHSSHRHIASLRRKSPDPSVDLGSAAAAARGLAGGDWADVDTAHGRASLRVRIDPSLQDDVAIAEFGWWEGCVAMGRPATEISGPLTRNINAILSDAERDPVSGSVPLRAVPCQITRNGVLSRGHWSGLREFVVEGRRRESADVVAIGLRPVDGAVLPDFLPGQHVMVHASAAGLSRAYSLTGPSCRPKRFEIAVRLLPDGRMSGFVHALQPGDTLGLEAPGGNFTPPVATDRPVVLVAAGIGITPFISYLQAVADIPDNERPPEIQLIYVCRDSAHHPFGPTLRRLADRVPQLRPVHVFTKPTAAVLPGHHHDRVGRTVLAEASAAFRALSPLAYVCGPETFVADAALALAANGVLPFDIFSELFTAAVSVPDTLQDRRVTLSRSGRSFIWSKAHGTLLDAADAARIALPSGCRTGQCESCSLEVLAGSVLHISAYSGAPDHCLTCRAVPLTDLDLDA